MITKKRLYEIIFEADTPLGKAFDVALIIAIIVSIIVVMLESVESFAREHVELLRDLEWIITILFTIEYLVRIYVVNKPWKYITSFYGVIDLLSILPTYIEVFIPSAHYFMIIRVLRLLRIFRVLKMVHYIGEATVLRKALWASRRKILVFLFFITVVVLIIGSLMYVVEGPEHGFTSIPRGMYWGIVTLTTVGFGDITPKTEIGQFLASIVMILGYGVIAVPTGIVTAELSHAAHNAPSNTNVCPNCHADHHADDAIYCKYCGEKL